MLWWHNGVLAVSLIDRAEKERQAPVTLLSHP